MHACRVGYRVVWGRTGPLGEHGMMQLESAAVESVDILPLFYDPSTGAPLSFEFVDNLIRDLLSSFLPVNVAKRYSSGMP